MTLEKIHNPDIFTCIANLSSDEVFTPPKIVSDMLDKLPEEIWKNENIKYLDPFSKSGVFLREITNMNKMRNNFNLQNPLHIPGQKSVSEDQYNDIIVKNKKLIHNLRSSFEHLWNSVKEE